MRHALLPLLVLLAAAPALGNPAIRLTLPFEGNVFTTPVVVIEGTVENSLTHPSSLHTPFQCRVWYSVAGRPWKLARTFSNGPDWTFFTGNTGEAALFRGVEDLFDGTQAVSVYAIDEFGRRSATVTRTVTWEKPKIPEAAASFDARAARLETLAERVRNVETDDEADVIEFFALKRDLGEGIGRELVFSETRNLGEAVRRRDAAAEPRVRYAWVEVLDRARGYYLGGAPAGREGRLPHVLKALDE